MKERGATPTSEILALQTMPAGADEEVQRELQLAPHDQVVCVKRLRLADGEPLALQAAYMIRDSVPGLVERGLTAEESLTEVLANEYGLEIAASQQRIHAALATSEDAERLLVPLGSPLLLILRTSYLKNGRPLEFLRDRRHPSWTFTVWLSRQ